MKKQLLLFLMLLPMAAWCADGDTFTAQTVEGVAVRYTIISESEKTAEVGTYNTTNNYAIDRSYKGVITIPETANGYSVTSIGDYAFSGCSGLTSIIIPNSVTSIEKSTFNGCTGLISITIPNSVTSIGSTAFSSCKSLTSITIPNSVIDIGSNAFGLCSNLKTVIIQDGLTNLGDRVFISCSSLESVTLPSTLTECNMNNAFEQCSALKTLILSDSDTPIKITKSTYVTELYMGRQFECSTSAFPNLQKLRIGEKVKTIPASLFSSYSKLASVDIAEGLETIEKNAFDGCAALKSITIPASVKEIGANAFADCSELVSLTLSDGDEALTIDNNGNTSYSSGSFSFRGCNIDELYLGRNVILKGDGVLSPFITITKVIMSNNVKTLPNYLFSYCDLLTTVEFSDNLETIGDYCFQGCKLLTVAEIKKCTTIGVSAFKECETLTTLTLPEGLEIIESRAFYGCTKMKKLTIPSSVTEIGSSAFGNCSGLKSITLLDGDEKLVVDNLDYRIFDGCRVDNFYLGRTISSSEKVSIISNVGTLEVGDKVKTIYPNMFNSCNNMEELTLGRNVQSIGDHAFSGCPYLTIISSKNPIPPVCKSYTFGDSPKEARLYVPKGRKATYEAADYWKEFSSIIETEDGDYEEPSTGIKGDVNGDGKVTITDAVTVVNIILNGGSEEE